MKKFNRIFIVFGIFVLISNRVLATEFWNNKENKKREEAFQSAVNSYMDTFLSEEVPEEDRITGYQMNGYGISEEGENDDKLNVSMTLQVNPVNENNTTWSSYRNHCFAVFSKIDGEYVLDRISRYPDNYDKFLERFEEYKNTAEESSKTSTIQGVKQDSLASQEIEKINHYIMIVCVFLFMVSSIMLVGYLRKRKIKC